VRNETGHSYRLVLTLFLTTAALVDPSGAVLAQYSCPAGTVYSMGRCQPYASVPSKPVTGAVTGTAAGAAVGSATARPAGAVNGGALGLGTGTVAGTANAVTGTSVYPAYGPSALQPPTCPTGYMLYNSTCYPAR